MIAYVANTVETTETMHKNIKSKNAELCNCDDISNIATFSTLISLGLFPLLQCTVYGPIPFLVKKVEARVTHLVQN